MPLRLLSLALAILLTSMPAAGAGSVAPNDPLPPSNSLPAFNSLAPVNSLPPCGGGLGWGGRSLPPCGGGPGPAKQTPDALDLQEPIGERCFAVECRLTTTGSLFILSGQAGLDELELAVEASFRYAERPLAGLPGDVYSLRAIRLYETAGANITVAGERSQPRLRPERRLIAVEGDRRGPRLFSPSGPLRSEELDLLDVPADSTLALILLPAEPVAAGDSWQLPDDALQGFLGLDALVAGELECTLAAVDNSTARIEFSGEAEGGVLGARTTVHVSGQVLFDTADRYISHIELNRREELAVGAVAPGLDVEASIEIDRRPIAPPRGLDDEVLAAVPLDSNPAVLQLAFEPDDWPLRFYYDRDWHLWRRDRDLAILRLVERSELIAQCNVARLDPAEPGAHVPIERFTRDVERALAGQIEAVLFEGEADVGEDLWAYKIVAAGRAGALPLRWTYYLVADPQGNQAVFTYIMETDLAERFATRDLEMLATVTFATE